MKFNDDEKMLAKAYGQVHEPFSVLTEYRGNKLNNMMTRGWHTTKAGRARAGGRVDVNNDINKVSDKFYKAFSGGQPVEGAVFKRWLQKQMGPNINIDGSPAFMRIPDTIETKRGGFGMKKPMGIGIIHDVIGDAHKIKLGGAAPAAPKKPYAWEPKGDAEEEEKRHGTTILGNDDNTEEDATAQNVAAANPADVGGAADQSTETPKAQPTPVGAEPKAQPTPVGAEPKAQPTPVGAGPVTDLGSKEPDHEEIIDDLVGGEQPDRAEDQPGTPEEQEARAAALGRSKEFTKWNDNHDPDGTPKAQPTPPTPAATIAPAPEAPVAPSEVNPQPIDRTSKYYKGQLTPGTPEYKATHGDMDPKNLRQHSKSPEDYTQQIIKLQHQIEDSPDRRGNAKLQKKLDSLFEARNQLIRRNIISAKRNVLAKPGFMSSNWGNF